MEKMNSGKEKFLSFKYLVIFLLSFFVGYYAKDLARNYLVSGFEDDKIKVAYSDYDSEILEEKIKEMQEEQENESGDVMLEEGEPGEETVDNATDENTGQ